MMNKDIAIGILAYNVGNYIEDIVKDISELGVTIYVINDFSKDDTLLKLKNLQKKIKFNIINNKKNLGAGKSTKLLLKKAYEDKFKFFVKVDGDGQFNTEDVSKIVELYNSKKYSFIKSNRFWDGGIVGKIPKKRFFGNLFATVLIQITTGTNKIFDPLNGLFGVSTEIVHDLKNLYPPRYGYPFYITAIAVIKSYSTFQINNTVLYSDQESKLNPFKVLFTLLKLFLYFYIKKIKIKKNIGSYQRSAFFDILFLISIFISLYLFIHMIFVLNLSSGSILNPRTLLFLLILSVIVSVIFFTLSFREEKSIRNTYVDREF